MKGFLLTVLLIFCKLCGLLAQPDSTVLLQEAATQLQNQPATVLSILGDKKYLPVHPLNSFRELIKLYSTPGILTITNLDEPGKRILVTGTIRNKDGLPVVGAIVYLYQTDRRGWYAANQPHVGGNEGDRRHARLFGYTKTSAKGTFELQTIKPSGYPNSDLPAHIHIEITAAGYTTLVSELLFDDDDRLQGERRTRAISEGFIIAKPMHGKAPFQQSFSYELKLGMVSGE